MLELFMKKLIKLIFLSIVLISLFNKLAQANVVDKLEKIAGLDEANIKSVTKYSLEDILNYENSYKKSGIISHKFKDYNFWTIKDNLSLDGKERKVVTITQKKYSDIINTYYIEYYKDGTIEFRKNSDPKDGKKNQWIISLHPKGINWYSERQYLWLKDKDQEQMIGRWKSRDENKWMYGVFEPDAKDPGNGLWPVFGYTKKDLDSQKNLSKKEKEKLFELAKKKSSEANKVFKLLTKLQKKYHSKVTNNENTNFATNTIKDNNNEFFKSENEENLKNAHSSESAESKNEEILKRIEQEKILLAKEKAELEELRKELYSKENSANEIELIGTDEKYYALIIGNNNYDYLEKLDAAQKDAEVISEILENKYDFNVKLLLNADYETIVDTLYEVTNKLQKNDNLLIYYAGHGEIVTEENRGYWLPVDASYEKKSKWISNQRIVDRIKATKAKHVLLISDSCFSGTLMRSGLISNSNEPIDNKYIKRLKNKKTRLVITSGGNEPVVDNAGGEHSLFALKLIETLRSNKNVINSQILFENIRRYVVSNADQTPERAQVHKAGHDGGDFLFFPKK